MNQFVPSSDSSPTDDAASGSESPRSPSLRSDSPGGLAGVLANRTGGLPPATANRLGLYLRELQYFQRSGTATIKSVMLARRLGLSDSQIRRDLKMFGQFGKRGVGYEVAGLVGALRSALGTDGQWGAILVGLGNLGQALLRYRGFGEQGFVLRAVFEVDTGKVGRQADGVPIYAIAQLSDILPHLDVRMAILAVPAPAAQAIADQLCDLGISGILNFTPVVLSVPKRIAVVDVDLALELQRLAFAVVNLDQSS